MQTKVEVNITDDLMLETLGYQYDSRDGELFLESGYSYNVYTLSPNNYLVTTKLDLKEEIDNVI